MSAFESEGCDSERCQIEETEKTITIVKRNTKSSRYDIHLRKQVCEGAPMKFVNGKLYIPYPYIKIGGKFEVRGLLAVLDEMRIWHSIHSILEVNGKNLIEVTREQLFDFINSPNELVLKVTSLAPQTFEKLNSNSFLVLDKPDISKTQEFPISVPDYKWILKNGEMFVVYKIYVAGRYLCSKRYSQFYTLAIQLHYEFIFYDYPLLPEKRAFSLSDQQLNERRSGLEKYLQHICSLKEIAETPILQKFLKCFDGRIGRYSAAVDLKILLPNRIVTVIVNVSMNSCTKEIYDAVVEKIGMSEDVSQYFRLFEIVDSGFERILFWRDCPCYRYTQNYREDNSTCLLMRKFLFTLSKEIEVSEDSMAASFFFWQAVDDISKGRIKPGSKITTIRALQKSSTKYEYLRLVRLLDGYGEISFPHCVCNARNEGHVIPIVSIKAFRLQACKDDGTMELPVVEFSWDTIKNWETDAKDMAFIFYYLRPSKSPRCIKIYTMYFASMFMCFRRIQKELKWLESADSEQ